MSPHASADPVLRTVAYDLRFAADHFPGIGTHAFCLLEGLLALPGDERYIVLWNPRLRQTRFDLRPIREHPRVTWVEKSWAPVAPHLLPQLGRWLGRVRPDLYFSPFYLLPVGAPCPCVLTLHDVWPLRLPGGLPFMRRMFYQLMIAWSARARLVVTSSQFSKSEIAELSAVSEAQVRVVPLGVPPERGHLEPRRPASLPRDPFALIVGVNKPHKNLPMVARAWALLGDRPPLQLVCAGPIDPRHPRFDELAREAGAKQVSVLGRVEEDELAWLYSHATVVLFPTRYEGFGFPLVEAFRHGAAAIASDIPTLRETGDGAAHFCDPDSPTEWAAAIERVARDPAWRAELQDKGLERVRNFTYERCARETLAVMREALTSEADPT